MALRLSTLILFVSAMLMATSAATAQQSLNEEQIAAVEAAAFTDWDGNEVKLSDFEGKTVLIDFWETWCSPCIAVMPTLNKLMDDYDDDFVVIAVSPGWSDSEEVVTRFISEHDYNFVFVHGDELATKLQIRGLPYKVYVNPDGTFYKAETGSKGPQREYDAISKVIEANR